MDFRTQVHMSASAVKSESEPSGAGAPSGSTNSATLDGKGDKKPEKRGRAGGEDDEFAMPSKPGQRYPFPAPGSGDRVFYESLLRENPDSLIAVRWHVEYGVFPPEKCEEMMAKLAELKEKDKERVTKILAKKERASVKLKSPSKRRRTDEGAAEDGEAEGE